MKHLTGFAIVSTILASCAGETSATLCAEIADEVAFTRQNVAEYKARISSLDQLSYTGMTAGCDDECSLETRNCVGTGDFNQCMIAALDGSDSRFDRSMSDLLGEQWRRPPHGSEKARVDWQQSRAEAFLDLRRARNSELAEALRSHADALGRSIEAKREGHCQA